MLAGGVHGWQYKAQRCRFFLLTSHVFKVRHHTWHDISHPDYYKKSRTSLNNMLYTLLNMLHTFSQEVLVLRRGKTDTSNVLVTHGYVIPLTQHPHTQQECALWKLGCLKYKLRKQAHQEEEQSLRLQSTCNQYTLNTQHIPQSLGAGVS